MSALIPGSGQIYDKRPGDGVVAFLAIGFLGGSSYWLWRYYEHKEIAVGFSLVTGFFYAGNIYTAWSSAKKYNKLYYEKHIGYLKETYWRGYKPELP
jgi:TM2 domain-containing membrane protein YozV